MIEFRTLGTLELTDAEGHEVQSVAAQPKPVALLAVLVLHSPDGYHRRDTLLGLLWPELEEQRARHALSQALHVLRQELGESVILKRGQEELRIDRDQLWCDAVAFQEAMRNQDHEAALGLYRGDLLPGFFVSEAAGFERWLGNERIRLQELAAGAAWKLAHRRIAGGELVEAERTAQRALSLVATDESEVRRFIDVLANAGDRAAAVRFYEKFAERLRAEYEVEPATETVLLVEAVRNSTAAPEAVGEAELPSAPANARGVDLAPAVQSARQDGPEASGRLHTTAGRWVAAAAVLIVITAVVGVRFAPRGKADDTLFVPNRVVVSLFENQTGDSSLAPLALMAGDWIADGLAQTGILEVVTTAAVRDAYAAAESQGRVLSGSSAAVTLAESMDAGIVVSGRLYRAADDLMIRVEAIRMPGVSALGAIEPVRLTPDDPGPVLESLRQRAMGLLAIHLDPRFSAWAKTARIPPTYEAYREFGASLGTLANPRAALGRPTIQVQLRHMLAAASLDTTFMAPLIQAVHYSYLMPGLTDSLERLIREREHLLTPVERYEVAVIPPWSDWFAYYQAMRRAADLAPDRLMELSRAAFHAGRYREAVEIVERPYLPLGLRPYPWKALTASLHFLGEHERELEAARRSREENPGHRDFMDMEITALAALGRIEEMEATMQESLLTGRTAEGTAPMGWFTAGNELMWHGFESDGRAVLDRVVTYIRAQPEPVQDRRTLGLALLFLDRGAEAREIFEGLVAQSEDSAGRDGVMARVGQAAAATGDRETALRISGELESSGRDRATCTFDRAMIAGVLGDCERAVELLDEALRLGVAHVFIHRRYGFMNCRDYPPFQEIAKPRG